MTRSAPRQGVLAAAVGSGALLLVACGPAPALQIQGGGGRAGELRVVGRVCGSGGGAVSSVAAVRCESRKRWHLVAGRGRCVEVWHLAATEGGTWTATLRGRGLHQDVVGQVTGSRWGEVAASVSRDGQMAVWRLGHDIHRDAAAAAAAAAAGDAQRGVAERCGGGAEGRVALVDEERRAWGDISSEYGVNLVAEERRAWGAECGAGGAVLGVASSWHGLYVAVLRRGAVPGFCGPGSRCSFRLPGGVRTVVSIAAAGGDAAAAEDPEAAAKLLLSAAGDRGGASGSFAGRLRCWKGPHSLPGAGRPSVLRRRCWTA